MSNPATARLVSGYTDHTSADLVGLSVASIRSQYGSTFNIPDGARATINDRAAEEATTLNADDELVFDKPTGSKG